MVSFLPHLVIPGLTAWALLPVEKKRLLWFAPLVWAPDLDYVIPSQHRAVSHSVLIPLALVLALVVLWRRRDPEAAFSEFATRPGAPSNLLIAAFFLSSHLVMDVFQGGVVLFWPLLNTNFYLAFQLLLDTGTNTFTPAAEGGTAEGAPPLSPVYPWFSTRDTAYVAFFALVALVWGGVRAWRSLTGRRPPRPVRVERTARAL